MKTFYLILALVGLALTACDNQSNIEKIDASANNVERSVKKAVNRVDEKTCLESDLECLADKAKHRTQEGADYVGDKTEEAVDKVD